VNKFTMNRKLSTEERVFVLQKWCQHDRNYRDVVDSPVKIRDLEHLKERIESEFENVFSQKICDTTCASVLQRCNRCIANGGGHFEHLVYASRPHAFTLYTTICL
jgi:hypothetical protein